MNMLRLICLLTSLSCLPATFARAASESDPQITTLPIASREINEASALSRSHRSAEVLWTLNDSGGATELYAITTEGKHIATLSITGAPANLDWEDLASYSHDGVPYLLIGDMGDNSAFRPFITFYRVQEPTLAGSTGIEMLSAMPSSVYNVAYPEGPRDNESLAVDGVDDDLLYRADLALQLLGADLGLQHRPLLKVLSILEGQGYLPPAVIAEMREGYEFLRYTEHALQALADNRIDFLVCDGGMVFPAAS